MNEVENKGLYLTDGHIDKWKDREKERVSD